MSVSKTGTYGYAAGTNATVVVPANANVSRIWALGAAAGNAATVAVNGGNAVPIMQATTVEMLPNHSLVSPTIVFTGTQSYIVEWVV